MKIKFLPYPKRIVRQFALFLLVFIVLPFLALSQTTIVYDNFGTANQNPINRTGWTAVTGGSSNWQLSTQTSSTGYTGASGGANVYTTMQGNNLTKTLTYGPVSTEGYDVVTLSFGARRSNQAVNELFITYSNDGTNFITWASIPSLTTTWTLYSGDLPEGALNQGTLYIRFSITTNNANARWIRLDDFRLTGIICDPITSFPFTEGFDGTPFPPTDYCWLQSNLSRVTSGTNPTCSPYSGAGMVHFNSYNLQAGTTGLLISPELDLPDDGYRFTFRMYRDNGYPTNGDRINVLFNDFPDLTGAAVLGTINRSRSLEPVETSDGWYEYAFNFGSGSAGAGKYVILQAVSEYGNNIFFDEFKVEARPIYADFTASSTYADVGKNINFTDFSGGGTITSWSWDFGADAVPPTANTQGPHDVYYTSYGQKTVSLTVNGIATTTKTNYISIAQINKPRELTATISGLADVDLNWLSPELNDGFEPYTDFDLDFGSYSQNDLDGSATYGISGVSFTNNYYAGSFILFNPSKTSPPLSGIWDAYAGEKYAACFAATSGPNDDWLITPKITVSSGEELQFYAKSITDQYGLERFRVGISTTGTQPSDFTIISSAPYLQAPTGWTEYNFPLTSYVDQEIYIGIHCVSDDAFCFMLDNLVVSDNSKNSDEKNPALYFANSESKPERIKPSEVSFKINKEKKASKSYASYKIYRNGLEIDEVTGFSFTDTDVVPGTHQYTVTALYLNPDAESFPEGPAEITLTGVWTGSIDEDWEKPGNWATNKTPLSTANISIPGSGVTNFPTITASGVHSRDLIINIGAKLTINPTATLTVEGSLVNNAGTNGLVIKSDADGTGSLLHSTTSVDAKVERYLTPIQWHFIGIPVEESVAGVFHLPSGHSDIYLRTHDESTNTWMDWIVPVSTPLIQGRGYACYVGSTQGFYQPETVVFPGKLNTGDFTSGQDDFYGLQYTIGRGLNLISNPYPSALKANIHNWDKNNIANKVYVWDASLGNYRYWNGIDGTNSGGYGTLTSGVIPSMQAFFIEATGSSPELTVPQSDRVHDDQNFYKSGDLPLNTIRIDVTGNNYSDAIFINFNPSATDGYDVDVDVEKLFGLAQAPQLYSMITEKKLSINSMPELLEDMTIPIGFECSAEGLFTIETSGIEGFDNKTELYLEDLVSGVVQDLKKSPFFSFFHNQGTTIERFVLHFSNPMEVQDNIISPVSIYSYGSVVYANLTDNLSAAVIIYDMLGREIYSMKSSGDKIVRIDLEKEPGYYLVSVQTGDQMINRKILIR